MVVNIIGYHRIGLTARRCEILMLSGSIKKTDGPVNQHYRFLLLWYHSESNQGHTDFQSVALPTELWYLLKWITKVTKK